MHTDLEEEGEGEGDDSQAENEEEVIATVLHVSGADPGLKVDVRTWKDLCYVTVGTFTRRGLSLTAKTLRSLSGVRGSEC